MKRFLIIAALASILIASPSIAAEYTVTPDMTPVEGYTMIESAVAGDVVTIMPGTYQYRVYLTNDGVTIKGSDPVDRPVFDYSGRDCPMWPGSNADAWNFYAWWVQAADVTIENIEITGARNPVKSSTAIYASPHGVYLEPAGPGTIRPNIVLRNLKLHGNDEGVTGAGDPLIVEDSEVFDNGVSSTIGKHNFYLQGGTAIIRNNKIYLSTPNGAANIQTRGSHTLIEGNDIGPFAGASHSVQMITDKADAINGQPFEQRIVLKNNTFSGIRNHANGMAKLVSAVNSNKYVGISMFVEMDGNTYNGVVGNAGSIVGLYDASGTVAMGAKLTNNTFYNNTSLFNVEPSSFFILEESGNTIINGGNPAAITLSLNVTWDQEIVADLDSWKLSAGSNPTSMIEIATIPYTEGMINTHDISYTATSGTVYFSLTAIDKSGNSSGPAATNITVNLPEPDTEAPPNPTNLVITIK